MPKEVTNEKLAKMMKDGFDEVHVRLDKVDGRLDKVDGRLDKVDGRLGKIEATMVTKDYLDEKLADLRGDIAVLIRKEDTKLGALVKILEQRKVLSPDDVNHIFSLEPFARLTKG